MFAEKVTVGDGAAPRPVNTLIQPDLLGNILSMDQSRQQAATSMQTLTLNKVLITVALSRMMI